MSRSGESYPVTYDAPPPDGARNRLTTAFRIFLALPHLLLVGGPGGVGWSAGAGSGDDGARGGGGAAWGVLGLAAMVSAIVSWFAIVFTGAQPRGLWDFTHFYLRWRGRAVAYMALLRDEYPPFGDGPYPASFDPGEFPATRDRVSVAFRLLLALPHAFVLLFVGLAWLVTSIIAWLAILLTGAYPEGLYRFSAGYLRWSLRFEAYVLLMRDEFPPFSLE
jgi:hypothetical protein